MKTNRNDCNEKRKVSKARGIDDVMNCSRNDNKGLLPLFSTKTQLLRHAVFTRGSKKYSNSIVFF